MVGRPALRPAAGRADLLRALGLRGEAGLSTMALLLGYREEERPPRRRQPSVAAPTVTAEPPEEERAGRRWAPVPFWRLESVEHLEEPDKPPPAPVLALEKLQPREGWPATPPIVPWPRLLPALYRALRSAAPSREIDVGRLLERWGRGEAVARLPLASAFAWSRRVTVLVDRSRRLTPFWRDQDALCRRLRRLLGRTALRVTYGLEGPGGAWTAGRRCRPRRGPAAVATGETVLAASDLGFFSGAGEAGAWGRLGRALSLKDVRLRAVVPCPAARWRRAVAGPWRAVDWSAPLRTAARAGRRPPVELLRQRSDRLLGLLAPAVRVEPGLLRSVRRRLPARDADVGTEADVWSHPAVEGASSVALTVGSPERWRERFGREALESRRAAVAELRRWHAALPQEIWLEELLAVAAAEAGVESSLAVGEAAAARRHALALSGAVLAPRAPEARRQMALERYYLRFGSRLPPELWEDRELAQSLGRAWGIASRGEPDAALPPGASPALLDDEAPEVERPWTAWQVGSSLEFRLAGQGPGDPSGGSPLATLLAARPQIGVAFGAGAWQARCRLAPEPRRRPLAWGPSLNLTTDRHRAELRRWTRPEWASAAGRDGFGLWAEVEVGEVAFRLRWIPPGRFWMGSPESEAGRWGDEGPRHQVTLTRGFWLAETPCTQALWQEVTGQNPSRFRSPDRPVEQVSWDDCQEFLKTLNQKLPGLEARLPGEAEWEYACRAGTETSTYAGELEILGQRNAPLLDGIAWYGGNSGVDFELENGYDSSGWPEKQYPHEKAGTHPVARKAANPCGLYDMLGNVWEWCADFWRDSYDEEAVEDPVGPAKGSKRVVRGGSWNVFAQYVRSARRLAYSPGYRYFSLGFRLARGQVEPGKASRQETARRPQGGVRRGTRRRHRGPDSSEER